LADEAAIAASSTFTVNRFIGRDGTSSVAAHGQLWSQTTYPTLEQARAARDLLGRDEHGRRPFIYAVSPSGLTIFVE
jgi:hypothetical protein